MRNANHLDALRLVMVRPFTLMNAQVTTEGLVRQILQPITSLIGKEGMCKNTIKHTHAGYNQLLVYCQPIQPGTIICAPVLRLERALPS